MRMQLPAVAIAISAAFAVAACGSSESADKIADAKRQAAEIRASATREATAEREAAQRELDDLRSDIVDRRGDLTEVKDAVKREEERLGRLRREARGVSAQIKANTIPGNGTFVVGQDIEPGTYRAAASEGCYWARLSSLNTSDIVDNDNAEGPVAVTVAASDKAFYTHDCADFHKVG